MQPPLSALAVFALLAAAALAAPPTQSLLRNYHVCVTEASAASCQEMKVALLAAPRPTVITCIAVRDRLDCLDKVAAHEADFVVVDPEDMYVAAKMAGHKFSVFKEIRSTEEPQEEFRYKAVAVVHNQLEVGAGAAGLRGLKSCHTGVARNVGYKIPITKLTNMGLLGAMNESTLSSRENELKALSQFFSKACLVGRWATEPALDRRLKSTYGNLCELCENPAACDYPDKYAGYDGALRCLTENGGDVAWTKVNYVNKHFGIGGRPATEVDAADYRYLCPDGSRVPVTDHPSCSWAARPWKAYLMTGDKLPAEAIVLQVFVSLAESVGKEVHADWLTKVLNLDDNSTAVDVAQSLSPLDYLNKANYTDVIERRWGDKAAVRMCTVSDAEAAKCRHLALTAFSRGIRPAFRCVRRPAPAACMAAVAAGDADVVTLDAGEVSVAQREFGLKPIVSEQYGASGGLYYAVAVVKKSSSFQSLGELKGAKSCHTGVNRTAGWNVPVSTLVSKELVSKTRCPAERAVAEFFSGGSCVPGAADPALCALCAGNSAAHDAETRAKSKCALSSDEDYFGYSGALRCLAAGTGDVAFVKHTTVPENTDGRNSEPWAAALNSADFELLCLDGGRAPVDQFKTCHLAEVPPHSVVTSGAKSDNEVDTIRDALLAAGELYAKKPEVFRLFGQYAGKKDLLFKDSATGLFATRGVSVVQQKYNDVLKAIKTCGV